MIYRLLADLTLLVHFLYIVFLLGGLLLILLGLWRGWTISRNFWFRGLHLTTFIIVIVFELAGYLCPLTYLEIWLRQKQDPSTAYFGSFIAHYIEELIYVEIPLSTIVIPSAGFALLTVFLFILAPPNRKKVRIYQN